MSADIPHDLPSLTLPDWRGALAKVRGKFRKPPKPPWQMVWCAINMCLAVFFMSVDIAILGGWLGGGNYAYHGFMATWWCVDFVLYAIDFRHYYRKWRNEWLDKEKPLTFVIPARWWFYMVVAILAGQGLWLAP